jgi:hypothetical protein
MGPTRCVCSVSTSAVPSVLATLRREHPKRSKRRRTVRSFPGRRECSPSGQEPERNSSISHPNNVSDAPATGARPPSSLEQRPFARNANMSGARSAHASRQSLRSGPRDILVTLNPIARRRWRGSWTSSDERGASRGRGCDGSVRSAIASSRIIRLSVPDVGTNGAISVQDHREYIILYLSRNYRC